MAKHSLAVSCRGLVKHYSGGVVAVNGLDLEVQKGECFGLLGPNGAGKTTTIEILEGLMEPTQGQIEILGHCWEKDADWIREHLGMTLQQTNLTERLTVREIIQLFSSFFSHGRDYDAVISLVALEDKRDVWYSRLSGGQKQRVAVACALVGDPDLLFLDEPTTGLDPQSRRQLWDLVQGLKDEGRTVLLTTHYMDEAEQLCNRVAIVDHGKVIAQGTPRDLISRVVGKEVVEFACKTQLSSAFHENDLWALPSVQGVRFSQKSWALTVEHVHLAIPALLSFLQSKNSDLESLSTHSATLEDVFVTLTGRNLRE